MASLRGLKEMTCILLVAALIMVGSLSRTVDAKAPAQCPAGFATCKTGRTCQTGLLSDVDNCGSCCAKCPRAPHSLPKCQNGTCGIYCNDREWRDCDGKPTNGCETNVNSNPRNCGTCGTVCPPAPQNGNATCCRGVCGFTCSPGFKDCDLKKSNGCEVNIKNDRANCGTCGRVCTSPPNSIATCSNGTCGFTCHAGFKDCDGNPFNGCETSIQVNGNCGDCGVTCDRPHWHTFCDASESYPQEFFCTYRYCDAGWADCDSNPLNGCETNTVSDSANCGACNTTCPSGSTCYASACTALSQPPPPSCPPGYADCDGNPSNGCETDVRADLNNCGACNTTCDAVDWPSLRDAWASGTTVCSDGVCSVDCDNKDMMGNCDGITSNGCETWYGDANNCNKCGYSCYRPHVYGADCGGTEFGSVTGVGSDSWVETNAYWCGGFACEDGWQNCDGDWSNGCELPSNVTCYAAPPPPW